MKMHLYYNTSDNRCVMKDIGGEIVIDGVLRESTNIISPEVTINSTVPLRYNYVYIPDFKRYYFINNVESVRNNLWKLYLKVDPLMSFKEDIKSLKVVIDKQSLKNNGDEYIDDGSLVTDNVMFKNVYTFSKGFNSESEYILITAG